MQKIDLLPCPFCGKVESLRMERIPFVYNLVCAVANGGCGASTGWNHATPEEAVKSWNARASGWIPCSERMPGRFDTVLIAILSKNGYGEPAYYVTIGGMKNGNEFESYTGNICECETVTHWMPLPSLPEVTTDSFSASSMSGGSA